jgi:hypothetical protein
MPEIHELLTRILRRKIPALHLVLLTRRDPALPHLAMGRPGEAREDLETIHRHAMATGNSSLLMTAKAFQAELALRQGRTAEAAHWAETFSPDPFTVAYRPYLPQMTLAKWHGSGTSPP